MKLSQLYFEVKLTAKICMELVTIVKTQESIPNLKKFVKISTHDFTDQKIMSKIKQKMSKI